MDMDLSRLPEDAEALQALVRSLAEENAGLKSEAKASALKIAKLEAQLAKLKRLQFGRSSEKLAREIEQLELELDALHEDEGAQAVTRPAAIAPCCACLGPLNPPCGALLLSQHRALW